MPLLLLLCVSASVNDVDLATCLATAVWGAVVKASAWKVERARQAASAICEIRVMVDLIISKYYYCLD